ncbi:MAG: lytic transglycosylase domain-containing protein [Bacteroidota bacterium]
MKKVLSLLGALFVVLIVIGFLSFSDKEDDKSAIVSKVVPEKNIPQIVKGPDLNKDFIFAGEKLPMDNFDVRERLDRELSVNTYWHSSTLLNIKKASRFFPVIERILKENGLPGDLKYLAVAESNLSNAVSPAGAKGFWQFMRPSAQQYKLEVNSEVDERYHLEKATQAACKYFKYLKDRFGTWTMAAAAYNVGPTKLARDIEIQRADTYFDLNLNQETSRYVFRLIAIKEILENPSDFGFYLDKDDYYPPLDDYRILKVNTAISNWGDFAKEQGISYRQLKIYNPWLIDSKLTNRYKKTYEVKIPK